MRYYFFDKIFTHDRGESVSSKRNFGLDVLRTLGILLVLLSHYGQAIPWWVGPDWGRKIPGAIGAYGTTGVLVFFVLSGFLVGGMALQLMEAGPNPKTIAIFLVRRWMRTVPLYWIAIGFYLCLEPPSHWLTHALRYFIFTQNLFFDMSADRWFAVSWSLSVEEWFYLLIGVVGLGLAMIMRPRSAAWITICLLIAGPLWLRWSSPRQNWFSYAAIYWFDTIAFGMATARLLSHGAIRLWVALPLAMAGLWCGWIVNSNQLALPAQSFVTFMPTTLATGASLLIPLALCWRTCKGWPAQIVQWISTRSYGLYLFHAPILGKVTAIVMAHLYVTEIGRWVMIVSSLITAICVPCLLAEISHRLVERPLMRLRPEQR